MLLTANVIIVGIHIRIHVAKIIKLIKINKCSISLSKRDTKSQNNQMLFCGDDNTVMCYN